MTSTETLKQNEPVVEEENNEEETKKKKTFFSWPLFQQSVKSTWLLWLLLAVGAAAIFVIINLVVGTKKIFTNIDMATVTTYVSDEDLSWLKLLGFLETMGFSLNRIQTMSQIDMNSVMNDLIYKIAGVLLPMVYVMIVANKLIAAQVSDGSMAYILSTPTNRKKVLRTQYFFLISSLFAMYLVITIGALVSEGIANIILRNTYGPESVDPLSYRFLRTSLYCIGSFAAIFALSGICFGASAFCNKSNKSIAIGGGASILCFLCCVLGLFGNKVFVAVGIGVKAMDFFNYLTLFTLIDTENMNLACKAITGMAGGVANLTWLWEILILLGIGIGCSLFGSIKFLKKDLPL